jgi:hypothetical protein
MKTFCVVYQQVDKSLVMSQRTTPGSPDVDSASDLLLKNLIAVKKQQKIRLSPVTLEHVPKEEEYVNEELGLVGTVTSHTPTLLQLKSQLKSTSYKNF